jgi:serine/threonine-protein phosphatase 2A regulatory subunit A
MEAVQPTFQGFSKLLEPEVVIARIVPFVRELCQDSSQHVRAALANQITGLAHLLGHGPTIDHLLQLFLHLLKDEFPDVRLNIISKLEQVNDGILLLYIGYRVPEAPIDFSYRYSTIG